MAYQIGVVLEYVMYLVLDTFFVKIFLPRRNIFGFCILYW